MGEPDLLALMGALAGTKASNDARVAWRTLSGEAAARGFPSARAFRDWCYRVGVTVRDVGGVALVAVGEVDHAGLNAPARPVPPSALPVPAIIAEVDRELGRR